MIARCLKPSGKCRTAPAFFAWFSCLLAATSTTVANIAFGSENSASTLTLTMTTEWSMFFLLS
jgi:hypothetical protein